MPSSGLSVVQSIIFGTKPVRCVEAKFGRSFILSQPPFPMSNEASHVSFLVLRVAVDLDNKTWMGKDSSKYMLHYTRQESRLVASETRLVASET